MDSKIIGVRGQSLSEMWGSRLGCLLVKVMVGRPYSIPLKLTLLGTPDFPSCSRCSRWSTCFRGIDNHRQPLQYFESKIFRNFLEACTASAYAKLCHGLPGLETQAE
jgi:hypothetical protein